MACFGAEAAGMRIVLIVPEIVGWHELHADARFHTPAGCLCICLVCASNGHVEPDGVNASQFKRVRHSTHSYSKHCLLRSVRRAVPMARKLE